MIKFVNKKEEEFAIELLFEILSSEMKEHLMDLLPDIPYLRQWEVCEMLNITAPTLVKYREMYNIPYVKVGRRVMYDLHAIESLIMEAEEAGDPIKYRRIDHDQ